MSNKYAIAMGVRVTGIVLSIVSISIVLIKPFDFVLNTLLLNGLLILAALLIMVGELIVISIGSSEEIKSKKQRNEAVYDVITTGIVIVLYVIFYAIPFLNTYIW
jgi:hypothetical protein